MAGKLIWNGKDICHECGESHRGRPCRPPSDPARSWRYADTDEDEKQIRFWMTYLADHYSRSLNAVEGQDG